MSSEFNEKMFISETSALFRKVKTPTCFFARTQRKLLNPRLLFEEYIAAEHQEGRWSLTLHPPGAPILLHGHRHQKAMFVMPAIQQALALLPETDIHVIETSCCGMAGSFGYATKTAAISRRMGELRLFLAVRNAPKDAIIVADGTSCRHQIADGTGRTAIHIARLFELALQEAPEK